MLNLTGKTALVTGGGSGIGRSISTLFAAQGARVAVVDLQEGAARETAATIAAAGGKATAFRCDISEAAEVTATFDAAEAALGPVNILVNNAGIPHVGTLESTSEADF